MPDKLPESQSELQFEPIKVFDMFNDCRRTERLPVNYNEFLAIIMTMEKTGYHIISTAQVEGLKQLARESKAKVMAAGQ